MPTHQQVLVLRRLLQGQRLSPWRLPLLELQTWQGSHEHLLQVPQTCVDHLLREGLDIVAAAFDA